MKIFKLTNMRAACWGTFREAVVCAETSGQAAGMHPFDGQEILNHFAKGWPTDASEVDVQELGTANAGIERGVLCASYRGE